MPLTNEELIEYFKDLKDTSSNPNIMFYALPIGSFQEFKSKVLSGTNNANEVITFGILLADPEQSECREYLLNYLNIFNKKSGKLFDFYIPGFTDDKYHLDVFGWESGNIFDSMSKNIPIISIEDKQYYFCRKYYEDFIIKLEETFGIQPTFNPMLILIEMEPGYIKSAKYVVIELDDLYSNGIRRSSAFFYEQLNILKKVRTLEEIVQQEKILFSRSKCIDKIISALAPDWLIEAKSVYDEFKRYQIKSK